MKPKMPPLPLPQGVEVVRNPKGLRFKGTANALLQLSENLRTLGNASDGTCFLVQNWILGVFEQQPRLTSKTFIAMPASAWNVVASKFSEVATGQEETPFDFSECGYLWPPPDPDIGVELVAAVLS